jgi:MerR family transcriptional regulator, copper efflux regulator
MKDDEKAWIISKLGRYKDSLLEREEFLIEELSRYQSASDAELGEFKDIEFDIYQNPQETYLITQIKISGLIPPVLERHILCIKEDVDLDFVLYSLELEIYKIKKEVYVNIMEWENLLDHLSDYRLLEIENNPKGPGDILIKDLLWVREYEKNNR